MQVKHFHSDAVAILIGAAGTVAVIHGGRIGAALLVKKGGKWGVAGRIIGGLLSFPATATVAG